MDGTVGVGCDGLDWIYFFVRKQECFSMESLKRIMWSLILPIPNCVTSKVVSCDHKCLIETGLEIWREEIRVVEEFA